MSEEVKPLFNNDILNGLSWNTPYMLDLYRVFSATRGPDIPLESAKCFKEAFTWRVRAAVFKEIEDNEWAIRVRASLEHGFINLFAETYLYHKLEPYADGYLHYLNHLIFAFKSLAKLSSDKEQKRFYLSLAKVCNEIFDYVRTYYPKHLFNAISLALKYNLTDTEKLTEALYSHSPDVVEAFTAKWKEYIGAEFPNILEKGGK
jgi:hypothetical protein